MRFFLMFLSLLWLSSCGAGAPASTKADHPESTRSREGNAGTVPSRDSQYLAYRWILPQGWTWADVDPAEIAASEEGGDVVFAQPENSADALAAVLVADYPAAVPGKRIETREGYLEGLREKLMFRAKVQQLTPESDSPYSFKENRGWRFDGTKAGARTRFSLRGFSNGRRTFTLWCEFRSNAQQCDHVFAGLTIAQQASRTEGDTQLKPGFVLDDDSVPFQYHPPGTGWMGRGPILSMGGKGRMWQWVHGSLPQIELNTSPMPKGNAGRSSLEMGQLSALAFQQSCASVEVRETVLGGLAAARLVLDGCRLPTQDMVVLATPDTFYILLVVPPNGERNESFVDQAIQGFEFR